MSKFLPDDPKEFAKFLRERSDGHAPGYDLAVYARPHQWLAIAKLLETPAAPISQSEVLTAEPVAWAPFHEKRGFDFRKTRATREAVAALIGLDPMKAMPLYPTSAQAPLDPGITRNSPSPEPCSDLTVNELIEWLDSPQYTNGFLDFDAVNHMSAAAELLDKLFPEALALPSASSPVQAPLTVGVLHDIFITMRHARTFITSREKMHPTGVELWDKLFAQIEELQASSVSSTHLGAPHEKG